MRISHTLPATWPEARAGRFVENVRAASADGCHVALLGLPDDTGVRLNQGRPGASAGPAAFRAALASYGTRYDSLTQTPIDSLVFDAGDVEPSSGSGEQALYETHRRVAAAARELHDLGLVVVGIGGGHDLTLPTVTALSKYLGYPVGGINVDAHLDVRKPVGSGMPFRRLIEGGFLDARYFIELGLGRFANDQYDFEWLRERGSELVLVEQVLRQGTLPETRFRRAMQAGAAFLSIDLDGLDASLAAGVSARNPFGLRLEHAAELAEFAGSLQGVRHFDLMELCPAHDPEQLTARLAAYLFLTFMSGFARRPM
jgi:formimidoylglutamase